LIFKTDVMLAVIATRSPLSTPFSSWFVRCCAQLEGLARLVGLSGGF
jgi:hypothetical protein